MFREVSKEKLPRGESSNAFQVLKQVVEFSPDGVVAFSKDMSVLLWNASMENMRGITKTEVLGKNILDVFPNVKESGEDRCYLGAVQGRTSISKNKTYINPSDGNTVCYDAYYYPLRDDLGEIIGGIRIVRDTRERKEHEGRVEELEKRFQHMADSAPVLLWMSGKDSFCNFFNQTWLDFTGRSLDQEWGVGWAEGIHPEDFQRCMDTYISAFNDRRYFEMEYRLRRRDGEYRWILDRGTPRYEGSGSFMGFIGSCVDITDIKMGEMESQRAIRLRDEFLSIASHELNTPLTSVMLQLDMLQHIQKSERACPTPEEYQKRIGIASNQLTRISDLIQGLLDVSRIEAGKLVLQKRDVDLSQLVVETVDRLEETIKASKCTVVLDVKTEIRGHLDNLRIEQVVVNLLTNAIKYGHGKPIEVTVSSSKSTGTIAVKDFGLGIEKENQERIFERFQRAVSADNYSGLGLGLYISKRIVDAHHGSIRVESDLGKGATFSVDLPLENHYH